MLLQFESVSTRHSGIVGVNDAVTIDVSESIGVTVLVAVSVEPGGTCVYVAVAVAHVNVLLDADMLVVLTPSTASVPLAVQLNVILPQMVTLYTHVNDAENPPAIVALAGLGPLKKAATPPPVCIKEDGCTLFAVLVPVLTTCIITVMPCPAAALAGDTVKLADRFIAIVGDTVGVLVIVEPGGICVDVTVAVTTAVLIAVIVTVFVGIFVNVGEAAVGVVVNVTVIVAVFTAVLTGVYVIVAVFVSMFVVVGEIVYVTEGVLDGGVVNVIVGDMQFRPDTTGFENCGAMPVPPIPATFVKLWPQAFVDAHQVYVPLW